MKRFAIALILLTAATVVGAFPVRFLVNQTAAATGAQPALTTEPPYPAYASTDPIQHKKAFVASVTTGTATVNIEASSDNVTWFVLATITLTAGTPLQTLSDASWGYYRANITASTGAVIVTMSP